MKRLKASRPKGRRPHAGMHKNAHRDDRVAPVHQRHLLPLLDRRRVGLVDQHPVQLHEPLGPHIGVLLVPRHLGRLWRRRRALERQRDRALRQDRRVAPAHGVDQLLVDRPDLVPLLPRLVLRGALREDELPQRLDAEAAAEDPLDGRHAGVGPAVDAAGVDEPGELALGQDGVDEVEAVFVCCRCVFLCLCVVVGVCLSGFA